MKKLPIESLKDGQEYKIKTNFPDHKGEFLTAICRTGEYKTQAGTYCYFDVMHETHTTSIAYGNTVEIQTRLDFLKDAYKLAFLKKDYKECNIIKLALDAEGFKIKDLLKLNVELLPLMKTNEHEQSFNRSLFVDESMEDNNL